MKTLIGETPPSDAIGRQEVRKNHSKREVVEQRCHSLELRYIDTEKFLGLVVGGGPSQ